MHGRWQRRRAAIEIAHRACVARSSADRPPAPRPVSGFLLRHSQLLPEFAGYCALDMQTAPIAALQRAYRPHAGSRRTHYADHFATAPRCGGMRRATGAPRLAASRPARAAARWPTTGGPGIASPGEAMTPDPLRRLTASATMPCAMPAIARRAPVAGPARQCAHQPRVPRVALEGVRCRGRWQGATALRGRHPRCAALRRQHRPPAPGVSLARRPSAARAATAAGPLPVLLPSSGHAPGRPRRGRRQRRPASAQSR